MYQFKRVNLLFILYILRNFCVYCKHSFINQIKVVNNKINYDTNVDIKNSIKILNNIMSYKNTGLTDSVTFILYNTQNDYITMKSQLTSLLCSTKQKM